MKKKELMEKLKNIIEDLSGLEMDNVSPTMSFIEIGLDSLLLTQLALILKKEFTIPITFRQLNSEFNNLGSLVTYLDLKVEKNGKEQDTNNSFPVNGEVHSTDIVKSNNNIRMIDLIGQQIQNTTKQLVLITKEQADLEIKSALEYVIKLLDESTERLYEIKSLPVAPMSNSEPKKSQLGDDNLPPVENARLGKDEWGNPAWFISDPERIGKYLKVEI